ncbi:MAG: hypothetical protein PHX20_06125, partial [Candidatus Omnitrophica bacterium]|nr:hypothetical protein [Candidatus Omnitrophota bacterium]
MGILGVAFYYEEWLSNRMHSAIGDVFTGDFSRMTEEEGRDYMRRRIEDTIKLKGRLERKELVGATISINDPWTWKYLNGLAVYFSAPNKGRDLDRTSDEDLAAYLLPGDIRAAIDYHDLRGIGVEALRNTKRLRPYEQTNSFDWVGADVMIGSPLRLLDLILTGPGTQSIEGSRLEYSWSKGSYVEIGPGGINPDQTNKSSAGGTGPSIPASSPPTIGITTFLQIPYTRSTQMLDILRRYKEDQPVIDTETSAGGLTYEKLFEEMIVTRVHQKLLAENLGMPTDEELDARPEAGYIRHYKALLADPNYKSNDPKWEAAMRKRFMIDEKSWNGLVRNRKLLEALIAEERAQIRLDIVVGRAMYWARIMRVKDLNIKEVELLMKQMKADRDDVVKILKAIHGQSYVPDFFNRYVDIGFLTSYSAQRLLDGIDKTWNRSSAILFLIDDSLPPEQNMKGQLQEYFQKLGVLEEGRTLDENALQDRDIWGKVTQLSETYLENKKDWEAAKAECKKMIELRVQVIDSLKRQEKTKETIIEENKAAYETERDGYILAKASRYKQRTKAASIPEMQRQEWERQFRNNYYETYIANLAEELFKGRLKMDEKVQPSQEPKKDTGKIEAEKREAEKEEAGKREAGKREAIRNATARNLFLRDYREASDAYMDASKRFDRPKVIKHLDECITLTKNRIRVAPENEKLGLQPMLEKLEAMRKSRMDAFSSSTLYNEYSGILRKYEEKIADYNKAYAAYEEAMKFARFDATSGALKIEYAAEALDKLEECINILGGVTLGDESIINPRIPEIINKLCELELPLLKAMFVGEPETKAPGKAKQYSDYLYEYKKAADAYSKEKKDSEASLRRLEACIAALEEMMDLSREPALKELWKKLQAKRQLRYPLLADSSMAADRHLLLECEEGDIDDVTYRTSSLELYKNVLRELESLKSDPTRPRTPEEKIHDKMMEASKTAVRREIKDIDAEIKTIKQLIELRELQLKLTGLQFEFLEGKKDFTHYSEEARPLDRSISRLERDLNVPQDKRTFPSVVTAKNDNEARIRIVESLIDAENAKKANLEEVMRSPGGNAEELDDIAEWNKETRRAIELFKPGFRARYSPDYTGVKAFEKDLEACFSKFWHSASEQSIIREEIEQYTRVARSPTASTARIEKALEDAVRSWEKSLPNFEQGATRRQFRHERDEKALGAIDARIAALEAKKKALAAGLPGPAIQLPETTIRHLAPGPANAQMLKSLMFEELPATLGISEAEGVSKDLAAEVIVNGFGVEATPELVDIVAHIFDRYFETHQLLMPYEKVRYLKTITAVLKQLREERFFESVLKPGEQLSSIYSAHLTGPTTNPALATLQNLMGPGKRGVSPIDRIGFADRLTRIIMHRQYPISPQEYAGKFMNITPDEVQELARLYFENTIKIKPRMEGIFRSEVSINDPWLASYLDAAAWYFTVRGEDPDTISDQKLAVLTISPSLTGTIRILSSVSGPNLNEAMYYTGDHPSTNFLLMHIAANIIMGNGEIFLDAGGIATIGQFDDFRTFKKLSEEEFIKESLRIRAILDVMNKHLGELTDEELDARPEAEMVRHLKRMLKVDRLKKETPKNIEGIKITENDLENARGDVRDSVKAGRAMYWARVMDEYNLSIADLDLLMAQVAKDKPDVIEILKAINGQDYEPDFEGAQDMGWLVSYSAQRLLDGVDKTTHRKDSILLLIGDPKLYGGSIKPVLQDYLRKLGVLKENQAIDTDTLSDPVVWGRIMKYSSDNLEDAKNRVKAAEDFAEALRIRMAVIDGFNRNKKDINSIIAANIKDYNIQLDGYLLARLHVYKERSGGRDIPENTLAKWKDRFRLMYYESQVISMAEGLFTGREKLEEKKPGKETPAPAPAVAPQAALPMPALIGAMLLGAVPSQVQVDNEEVDKRLKVYDIMDMLIREGSIALDGDSELFKTDAIAAKKIKELTLRHGADKEGFKIDEKELADYLNEYDTPEKREDRYKKGMAMTLTLWYLEVSKLVQDKGFSVELNIVNIKNYLNAVRVELKKLDLDTLNSLFKASAQAKTRITAEETKKMMMKLKLPEKMINDFIAWYEPQYGAACLDDKDKGKWKLDELACIFTVELMNSGVSESDVSKALPRAV